MPNRLLSVRIIPVLQKPGSQRNYCDDSPGAELAAVPNTGVELVCCPKTGVVLGLAPNAGA